MILFGQMILINLQFKLIIKNFSKPAVLGDLNEIELDSIPVADVLIGGFPCQPFSMMG